MQPDPNWRRVQQLIESAEALPPEARPAWLAEVEPDHRLRAEVLDLLAAMRAETAAARTSTPAPSPLPPATIGPYRVLRRVGSGGRGVVYAAERDIAGGVQTVALKVLPDHLLAAADLERFEREQRILAGLHHPSICRFLDAAWDADGRPYLVLEWIDGVPVDEYCEREALPEVERIRLIATALDAVQAAHQCLVVHLDLKPSNLLIDQHGKPRLIDFGTAKLLAEDLAATATRQLTPRFASPEQLRGEPCSTASDIYSAALTLYALLTSSTAVARHSSLAALAERAADVPAAVSLPGRPDLEAVLTKALDPDPRRRYRTAAEFAGDLQAYLARRPVAARRLTFAYQFTRFAQRHRRAVLAVLSMATALVAVGTYAAVQQQQRWAETRRAADIGTFLLWMIESSATAHVGQTQVTVLDMVQRANQRIEAGLGPPDDVAAMVQSSLAYVARESGREDLGEPMARAALARADRSGLPAARVGARQTLADILIRLGKCSEAIQLFAQADSLFDEARLPGLPAAVYLGARANARLRCESDPAGALQTLDEALVRGTQATAVVQASLHLSRALTLTRLQRTPDARNAVQAGLRQAASHPDGRYMEVALLRIGAQIESGAGVPTAALPLLRQAAARAPGVTSVFERLRLQALIASAMTDAGDPAGAGVQLESALGEIRQRRSEVGPSYWMLLADAAEVQGRRRACPAMHDLYREVDALTGAKMPRDWTGNRRYFEAECATGPDRARLAAEALREYGALLPPTSRRAQRLRELAATAPARSPASANPQ